MTSGIARPRGNGEHPPWEPESQGPRARQVGSPRWPSQLRVTRILRRAWAATQPCCRYEAGAGAKGWRFTEFSGWDLTSRRYVHGYGVAIAGVAQCSLAAEPALRARP
jgi:hypothetical protein